MPLERLDAHALVNECCWCGKRPRPNREHFALSGVARDEVDLSPYEGAGIRIPLETQTRRVDAIVPTATAPARREGYNVIFVLCSRACGAALRDALRKEILLGQLLREVADEAT
ncbi:MAG: hypothetical protein HY321_13795 [Armatimonadetes bacterium]|nr:hypothetical protein [Armatimonadota bacterium]